MKGMMVRTDGEFFEVELDHPLYKSAGEWLGGNAERIVPLRLDRPYCMIVNGESAMLGLCDNRVGSLLYGTEENEPIIMGDFLILKDVWKGEGVDITGLEHADIACVTEILEDVLLEVEFG